MAAYFSGMNVLSGMQANSPLVFTHPEFAEDFKEIQRSSLAALPDEPVPESRQKIEALRCAALQVQLVALNTERAIVRMQTAYGYYVDKAQWDEAADLFARDVTLEIAARGVYRGRERIRTYLHQLPPLQYGSVFNHVQLQQLITLADDGNSARGRWRAIMEVGFRGREELCGEATYENEYLLEAPQSVAYGSFPDEYIPPYHYPNAVTGRRWSKGENS